MSTSISPQPTIVEDKTAAIVSYLTLVGFIAAIFIHNGNKTSIGAFHLRQSLGLILSGIAIGFCASIVMAIPFLGWLLGLGIYLGFFVLWVLGFLAALSGQPKPVPLLGEQFQKWFATAFT